MNARAEKRPRRVYDGRSLWALRRLMFCTRKTSEMYRIRFPKRSSGSREGNPPKWLRLFHLDHPAVADSEAPCWPNLSSGERESKTVCRKIRRSNLALSYCVCSWRFRQIKELTVLSSRGTAGIFCRCLASPYVNFQRSVNSLLTSRSISRLFWLAFLL